MAPLTDTVRLQSSQLSIRSYGRFVARHLRIIGMFVVTGLLIGLALAVGQPREFSAVSRVALTPQESVAAPEDAPQALLLVSLDSDAQLLESTSVLGAAAATLDWHVTAVGLTNGLIVSAVPNSRVLIVRYDNPVATRAIDGCNAIVTAFLKARAAAAGQRSATARASLEQQISDVSAQLFALQATASAPGENVLADQLQRAALNAQLEDLRINLAQLPSETSDPGIVVSPARQRGSGQRSMATATVTSGILLGLIVGLLSGRLSDFRTSARRRQAMPDRAEPTSVRSTRAPVQSPAR